MDNITLRQDILDELDFEPSIEAAHIGVAVNNGVVTLTGYVSSYAERIAAEHAVQRVKGVHAIAQEIEVRYPGDKKTSDDQIAERAVAILRWDTSVPDDRIKIKVHDGFVTLTGEVDWFFQKEAAENAVRKLSGVIGVANLVTIHHRVDASNIKKRIEDAFKRSAEVDAEGIHVKVSGGKVTLEGRVKAWHERGAAERAAWAAPGVTAVEDHLRVA